MLTEEMIICYITIKYMRIEIRNFLRHPTQVSMREFRRGGALAVATLGILAGAYGVVNLGQAVNSDPSTYALKMREVSGATSMVATATVVALGLGLASRRADLPL